jgi:hypothetical protein
MLRILLADCGARLNNAKSLGGIYERATNNVVSSRDVNRGTCELRPRHEKIGQVTFETSIVCLSTWHCYPM